MKLRVMPPLQDVSGRQYYFGFIYDRFASSLCLNSALYNIAVNEQCAYELQRIIM